MAIIIIGTCEMPYLLWEANDLFAWDIFFREKLKKLYFFNNTLVINQYSQYY